MEQLPPPGTGSAPDASLAGAGAFFDLTRPPVTSANGGSVLPPPPPTGGGTATMTAISPSLPQVAPPVPRPATAPAVNPFGTMLNDPTPLSTQQPKKKSNRGKRFVGGLLVLALIGGAAAAAVMYGSDLMTLATGDEVADEPELANVFPTPTSAAPVIRTASFTVEQPAGASGPGSYQATIDFETTIAEVSVDGGTQPDIEMLTLFNDAVVRRAGSVTWFQLPRGTFPIGIGDGRARWIRTVDELFPPAIRQWATVERATESDLEGEPMTRVLVSIDPARLASAPATSDSGTPTDAGRVDTVGAPAEPVPAEPVTIEFWADDAGVIRKLILPPELGGETVTVLSYSADPWQPAFPTAEQVRPITADDVFDLAG